MTKNTIISLLRSTVIIIALSGNSFAIDLDKKTDTVESSQTIQDLGKGYSKNSSTSTIYYHDKPIKVYSPNTFKILPEDHKRVADYDAVDAYVSYKDGNIIWNGKKDDLSIGPSIKTLFDDQLGIPIDCRDVNDNPPELFKCYQQYVYPEQWAALPALNPDGFKAIHIRASQKWYVHDDKYLVEFKKDQHQSPSIYQYLDKKYSPKDHWSAIYYSQGSKIFYEVLEQNNTKAPNPLEIIDADLYSFEILESPPYSKDKNNVYYYDKKLTIAIDPQTFKILNFNKKRMWQWLGHNILLTDKAHIYFLKNFDDDPENAIPVSLPIDVDRLSLESIQNDVSGSIFVKAGSSIFYIHFLCTRQKVESPLTMVS